jgi:transcriptional/translational regulatory protein YebC/TACO1
MFDQKGVISVPKDVTDEETLMTIALDAGADDLVEGEDEFEVFTPLQSFDLVRKALDENKVAYTRASLTRIPQNSVPVEGKVAAQLIRLLEDLEDQDDVQNVYANFEIDENELAELTA